MEDFEGNNVYFYYVKKEDKKSFLINVKLSELHEKLREDYYLAGSFISHKGKIKLKGRRYIEFEKGEMRKIGRLYCGKFHCFKSNPASFDSKNLKQKILD